MPGARASPSSSVTVGIWTMRVVCNVALIVVDRSLSGSMVAGALGLAVLALVKRAKPLR